ncbi:MAG TPA: hypothetical protein VGD08_16315 [Stellaceae bacterium]
MQRRPGGENAASQEYLLLEHAERLGRFRAERRAVHIHLSRLRPYNRREHHIRVAANTFESLVNQFEGQLFLLANADIVFICKGGNVAAIDDAVMRLRYLFDEDPLIQGDRGEPDGSFCTWYDIEREYERFLAAVRALHDEEQQRNKRIAAIAGTPAATPDRAPLDPRGLGELVDAIARADLSNLMRRQTVCALLPNAAPQPVFRELYISIAELRDSVMPGIDIAGDRWLFQHLTQTLDRRMLKLLIKNDDRAIGAAFSVNLNVSTLLSPEFLAFDATLRANARGTIVIELQLIDIFADVGTFLFARDFVKERGYRVCLDGASELLLPHVDREKLGLDLVKLAWRPSMLDADGDRARGLRDLIDRTGRTRVILCHCDNAGAVAFGQALGITMFQGRHIDKLTQTGDAASLAKLRAAAGTARR